jgi:D-amino-acid dehydrogenase
MKHVLIIGSGLIGLSTAYALKQRGVPYITILDGAPGPHGASVVNAGWLTTEHSEPVGVPGMTGQALKWMLKSDSPLYIRPAVHDLDLMIWLFRFWRTLNDEHFNHATAAMIALNQHSAALFDAYVAAGVRFELHHQGNLHAFLSGQHLERGLKHTDLYRKFGFPEPRVYWGNDARAFEPALSRNVSGAFHLEADRHVRPETLTDGLVDWLAERGVSFQFNTSVAGLDIANGYIRAVEATAGRYEADAVVIAAGAYSGQIAKMAGKKLPIQAGKGYKIDYAQVPAKPVHTISLHEARMAVTPTDAYTRLAGTMELSGINSIVRRERVRALARGAAAFLRDWPSTMPEGTIGSGLRPMTPDGIPIIGAFPGVHNLSISTGHQMLGLSLAPASAEALADVILTGKAPAHIEAFTPTRF